MAPEVEDPKKLLKIVNYQNCQKTVLSQMERWAATNTHLDQIRSLHFCMVECIRTYAWICLFNGKVK